MYDTNPHRLIAYNHTPASVNKNPPSSATRKRTEKQAPLKQDPGAQLLKDILLFIGWDLNPKQKKQIQEQLNKLHLDKNLEKKILSNIWKIANRYKGNPIELFLEVMGFLNILLLSPTVILQTGILAANKQNNSELQKNKQKIRASEQKHYLNNLPNLNKIQQSQLERLFRTNHFQNSVQSKVHEILIQVGGQPSDRKLYEAIKYSVLSSYFTDNVRKILNNPSVKSTHIANHPKKHQIIQHQSQENIVKSLFDNVMNKLNQLANSSFEAAEDAQQVYVNLIIDGQNQGGIKGTAKTVFGYLGGTLASLWTRDTALPTALVVGPLAVAALAEAGAFGGLSVSILKLTQAFGIIIAGLATYQDAKDAILDKDSSGRKLEVWERALKVALVAVNLALAYLGAKAKFKRPKLPGLPPSRTVVPKSIKASGSKIIEDSSHNYTIKLEKGSDGTYKPQGGIVPVPSRNNPHNNNIGSRNRRLPVRLPIPPSNVTSDNRYLGNTVTEPNNHTPDHDIPTQVTVTEPNHTPDHDIPTQVDGVPIDFTEPKIGTEEDINTALKAHLKALNNDWVKLKNTVINKYKNEKLMRQFIGYRQEVYNELVREIELEFKVKYKTLNDVVFKDVAPGSKDLTSDIDATFISTEGDKQVEIAAVEEFNRRFRQQFGRESGNVFDLNVYTTGHMPKAAFGKELEEITQLRKLREYLDLNTEIAKQENILNELPSDASQNKRLWLTNKIEGMKKDLSKVDENIPKSVSAINNLRKGTSRAQLEVKNLDSNEIREQEQGLIEQLQNNVRQELSSENVTSPNTRGNLLADKDIMALLKQRRNMSSREWEQYQTDNLSRIKPDLRNATQERFIKTEEVYQQAEKELNHMVVLLNEKPGENRVLEANGARTKDPEIIKQRNRDAELEASNRLNEYYLRKAQTIREKLGEQGANKDQLTLELNEAQSKALFFANEAYQTRAAAMDIVLNQQLRLEIDIPIEEYLISINEQIGFALEQISEKKGVGTSLWKSAKYIDRVIQDIEQINKMRKQNKLPSLFSEETQRNVYKVKWVSDELLKIKKGTEDYYELNPDQQTTEAEKIGVGYPFSSIENIKDLRNGLLEFSVEINTQIREGLQEKYNTSPSTLNQKVDINDQELNEHLDKFYAPDRRISSKPTGIDNTAKSTTLDWNIEMVS